MKKKLAAKAEEKAGLDAQEAARPSEENPCLTAEDWLSNEADARRRASEDRWRREMAALRRAAAESAHRRIEVEVAALANLARVDGNDSFHLITRALEDPSAEVRNAAVRALYDLNPELAAAFFNCALREGLPDRRRKIGAALAGSGLANDAINNLTGESHKNMYGAFSLLFLVAKAGEVSPLLRVIKDHPSIELRLALIKLLALSGEGDIVPVFQRLALCSSLPSEVRSAVMDAINQLNSK